MFAPCLLVCTDPAIRSLSKMGRPAPTPPRISWTNGLDLMAENQDLRVLRGVAARQQPQPAEHPDHEEVDETDQHERRA